MFEGYSCFKSTLAVGLDKGYEVDVQVGCCFIQMQVRREHSEVWITLGKAFHILVKYLGGEPSGVAINGGILPITNLHYDFVERFFLLSEAYFFVIIIYHTVGSCLLGVVFFECFIKQFVVHITDIFITVGNVLVRPFWINVACVKGTIVVSE